ncbi:MAG: HAD-IA family hydrolase [Pseudomonadota bacterium]
MLKLAIWDMDGTIVDSREVITMAMARAFETCGLPPPGYDETRTIVGLDLAEACRRLAPPDVKAALLGRLVEAYRNAFIARRKEPGFKEPLYEGALETLQRMRDDNWLIAMATGKSKRGIEAVFSMHPLAQYFDTVHCADDGPGKPNPAMVNAAMDRMGADADRSVMIGDAVFDMQMGRAAGVHCLGVSWGFGETGELENAGAHAVHHDFRGLNKGLTDFAERVEAAALGGTP